MQISLFQYVMITLIASTGLLWGALLRKLTPAEMEPGKIYFRALTVLLSGVAVFLVFYSLAHPILAVLPALAIAYSAWKYPTAPAIGLALGIAILITRTSNLFLPVAATVFLYGLPAGALIERQPVKSVIWFIGVLLAVALLPMVILYL